MSRVRVEDLCDSLTSCLHSGRVFCTILSNSFSIYTNVSIVYFNIRVFHEMLKAIALWFGYAG